MERIIVVGCIGTGKSTVARAIARTLGIEVFHRDRYWWKPGRYRVIGRETVAANTMDPDEFSQLEEPIVARDRWVVDGDAANKDLRLARAAVVFLYLRRCRCIAGLVHGHVRNTYDYPDGVQGAGSSS